MNLKFVLLILCLATLPLSVSADEDKEVIPPVEDSWNDKKADGNRSVFGTPSLFRDVTYVYVYSEKQLDNVSIGITDMQGNTYHYEVTTIPAGVYYAVSIESLPEGQYYLSVYQGSNYVMGVFQK